MKTKHIYIIGVILCAAVQWLFCGCSDDQPDSDSRQDKRTHELRLSLGTSRYDMTRASGDLPTDFELYNNIPSLQPFSQIQGYMTYDEGGSDYVSCVFDYAKTADDKHTWGSRVILKKLSSGNKYYLYGYMPKEDVGSNVVVTPYDNSYAKGAVLVLNDLNAVTPNDICVIVGAKGYEYDGTTASIPDMSSRLGVFDYVPGTDSGEDGDDLYLLVDHIYAGLKFEMKLGTTYSQLRGIKIKSITLIPENGSNDVIETVNATVTIVANTHNENPIVPKYTGEHVNISGNVTFENSKAGKNPKPAVIYDGEGKDLTTTAQEFLACFCPSTNSKFILETKYDVYDRKGNLIREDETARNAISLQHNLTSGQMHTVKITVQPTFLYMLSEPDLDNPTFKIE